MSDNNRQWLQLGLACVGAVSILGTIATALYHGTRQALDYWTAGETEAE